MRGSRHWPQTCIVYLGRLYPHQPISAVLSPNIRVESAVSFHVIFLWLGAAGVSAAVGQCKKCVMYESSSLLLASVLKIRHGAHCDGMPLAEIVVPLKFPAQQQHWHCRKAPHHYCNRAPHVAAIDWRNPHRIENLHKWHSIA